MSGMLGPVKDVLTIFFTPFSKLYPGSLPRELEYVPEERDRGWTREAFLPGYCRPYIVDDY